MTDFTITVPVVPYFLISDSGLPVIIGGNPHPDGVDDVKHFAGLIDEVMIFDKALSAKQIKLLFEQGL